MIVQYSFMKHLEFFQFYVTVMAIHSKEDAERQTKDQSGQGPICLCRIQTCLSIISFILKDYMTVVVLVIHVGMCR